MLQPSLPVLISSSGMSFLLILVWKDLRSVFNWKLYCYVVVSVTMLGKMFTSIQTPFSVWEKLSPVIGHPSKLNMENVFVCVKVLSHDQ